MKPFNFSSIFERVGVLVRSLLPGDLVYRWFLSFTHNVPSSFISSPARVYFSFCRVPPRSIQGPVTFAFARSLPSCFMLESSYALFRPSGAYFVFSQEPLSVPVLNLWTFNSRTTFLTSCWSKSDAFPFFTGLTGFATRPLGP